MKGYMFEILPKIAAMVSKLFVNFDFRNTNSLFSTLIKEVLIKVKLLKFALIKDL